VELNLPLYKRDQIDTIKELMDRRLNQDVVRIRIEEACNFLGRMIFEELIAIGNYKLRRNAIVHKAKGFTRDVALNRLDIAGALMTSQFKKTVEKCVNIVYR